MSKLPHAYVFGLSSDEERSSPRTSLLKKFGVINHKKIPHASFHNCMGDSDDFLKFIFGGNVLLLPHLHGLVLSVVGQDLHPPC